MRLLKFVLKVFVCVIGMETAQLSVDDDKPDRMILASRLLKKKIFAIKINKLIEANLRNKQMKKNG